MNNSVAFSTVTMLWDHDANPDPNRGSHAPLLLPPSPGTQECALQLLGSHVSGIIHSLAFCIWLLSVNLQLSKLKGSGPRALISPSKRPAHLTEQGTPLAKPPLHLICMCLSAQSNGGLEEMGGGVYTTSQGSRQLSIPASTSALFLQVNILAQSVIHLCIPTHPTLFPRRRQGSSPCRWGSNPAFLYSLCAAGGVQGSSGCDIVNHRSIRLLAMKSATPAPQDFNSEAQLCGQRERSGVSMKGHPSIRRREGTGTTASKERAPGRRNTPHAAGSPGGHRTMAPAYPASHVITTSGAASLRLPWERVGCVLFRSQRLCTQLRK